MNDLIQSEQIDKIAPAFIKMQAEVGVAVFDATNPFHHNKYATLSAYWDAAREILALNDLALLQWPIGDGERFGVMNILMHESGQYMGASCMVRPAKSAPQELMSLLTYLRRNSMSGALGIVSGEDDDDGNKATFGKRKELSGDDLAEFAQEAAVLFGQGKNPNQVYAMLKGKYEGLALTTVMSCKREIDNEQEQEQK